MQARDLLARNGSEITIAQLLNFENKSSMKK